MKILYISGPSFFDLDLSFLKSLGGKVECYFLLDLYPKLHKATAVNILKPVKKGGIFPITIFKDLDVYRDYFSLCKAFVINRTSNNPLALSNLTLQWHLLKFVKKIKPDVVHFNNHIYFNHFYLFLYRGKKIISIHDPFPHSGDEKHYASVKAKITRFINNKYIPNHLLFNKAMLNQYRESSKLHKTNIVSTNLGVYEYLNLFSQSSPLYTSEILFFGRISKYKGLDTLLSSFQQLLEKMPDIKLSIAGAGDLGFDPNNYNIPNENLNFINRYLTGAELASLINHSKVIVCPYKNATQSGVIMTAFALCKPVVATKVGGLGEMVQDGVTGTLIPPNDPTSLTEALFDLLHDEKKRLKMEINIKNTYYNGEKSWNKITDRILHFYTLLK